MSIEPINIFLIEDNPGDVALARKALEKGKIVNNLYIAADGIEAMKFLCKEDEFLNAPTPDLILLDLNLPKKDGREVLLDIKNDEVLRLIPVVVLTTSTSEADILKTYGLHANCYITKPVELDKFIDVVRKIEDFWLTVVKLPTKA